MCDVNEAYRNLAAAIVLEAVNEYKAVLPKGKTDQGTSAKRLELESFFDSSWCGMLCGIKGSDIKRRLQLRNC